MTEDWCDEYAKSDGRYLSRGNRNALLNEQWRQVKRYARRHRLDLRRRFYDAEGTNEVLHASLPLHRRRQLAELFVAATRVGVRTVLVDSRVRLEEDDLVRAVLCGVFRDSGVRIIEVASGQVLTEGLCVPTGVEPTVLRKARRVVGKWRGLVSRLVSGTVLGRKPFGASDEEKQALGRLRQLYRVRPRAEWRRQGQVLIRRRSFREIAATLNAERIPTRTGRPWSGTVVLGILKRMKLLKPDP